MGNMWRPNNWWKYDTKVPLLPLDRHEVVRLPRQAFEAGADAMLEALRPYHVKVSDVCDKVNSLLASMGAGNGNN